MDPMVIKNRVMPKILVVDDETDAIELIQFNLKESGFEVVAAKDGEEAIKMAKFHQPDLMVLDVMMPVFDGFEVCKRLKMDQTTLHIPTIMLTAKASDVDRILGLELGADDYLTKPYSPRELALRIRNLLKRKSDPSKTAKKEVFQIGNIFLDIARHLVTVDGKEIDLTVKEFNLLATLMQRRGRVQSREKLLQDVWDYESSVDTRTVDTHVRRLRDKLGSGAEYIDTVRGVGYRMLDV